MLRQIEVENAGRYPAIICDARANKPELTRFMIRMGYSPLVQVSLYDRATSDIVLTKFLDKSNRENLVKTAKNVSLEKAV